MEVVSDPGDQGKDLVTPNQETPRRGFLLLSTPATARFEAPHEPLRLPIVFRAPAVRLLPTLEIPLDSPPRRVYFTN